ncbi:HEAT repeat domain-containing protein [Laspinema olomoucense]|uniref:HEAT repeat domain-containing protein n=1 Tax=Laspinema olomoucense D3b TaxID=2953688 RepID=A0ABT2NA07_9CYAN|nr:HEAT repeat domain-containing protein [Laspinema sp. D3b]MCT7979534.1 HEAT repeat domain-containing protein [Laspinema sp. D3b]
MPPTLSHLLEQANAAAKQEDWQLVTQCLEKLATIPGTARVESLPVSTEQPNGRSPQINISSLLGLADQVLEYGDFQQRWEVAKVFPRLGTEAIAPLLDILGDPDAEVELRWFAGRILAEFKSPDAIAALIELLHSPEEELSSMAGNALAQMGEPAIAALSEQLRDSTSRALAVRSLGKIRHPQIIEPLLSVVGDRDPQVRSEAIAALNSYDDPRIPQVLVESIHDFHASVRREATIGLGLCAMRPSYKHDTQGIYSVLASEIEELLRERLWDFNPGVTHQAAISLGRVATPKAAACLDEILHSPATPIPLQINTVRALAWMGTPEALEYLEKALVSRQKHSSSPEVVAEIVSLLGRVEVPQLKPKAAQMLTKLLNSKAKAAGRDWMRREQAIASALGYLGQKTSIEPLIQLLATSEAGVRFHAIAALKQIAPDEAYRQLLELSCQPTASPSLKQGVAIALEEWVKS